MTGKLMQPMTTAPKDGTKILIKRVVVGFDKYAGCYKEETQQIIECWYTRGCWQEWIGPNSLSTKFIKPLGWWPKSLLREEDTEPR